MRGIFWMKRVKRVVRVGGWLPVAAALLLAACSSAPPQLSVAPDGWTYGPRLITLQLEATETLNIDSGQAHALSIGVFQLSDPGSFGALSASPAGAEKLLDEGATGDPSIVDFDRVVLQPGEKRTVYLNRASNAQYVGIVAGYYTLTSPQDVALYNIPVVAKPEGWVTKGMVAVGLQSESTDGMPGALALSVGFGPDQVAHFTSDTSGSARIFASSKGGAKGGAAAGGKGGSASGGSGSGSKLPSVSLPKIPTKSTSSSGGGGGG